MDEKISLNAVDQYSETYAAKMVSLFFATKDRITGPQILSLCDIKQVNLFVLRELMSQWKLENQKLKSPYFDYDADEVAKLLKTFQNTLSNHISITKADFLPLLKKAVSQTIYLILDPYDFYADTLDRQGDGALLTADLRADVKYMRINKAPLENLVQRLEATNISFIKGNEAFALLDTILEEVSFTPEDIDTYVGQFSRIAPLQIEKLYETSAPNLSLEEQGKNLSPNLSQNERSINVSTDSSPKEKEILPPPMPVVKTAENRPISTSNSQAKQSAPKNFQKITQIKDTLTINQKFMFTKILFNGDFEIFSQAIDRLDKLDNLNQAMKFIDSDYPEWDRESEEYLEFIEMVEKRFL